MSNCYKCDCSCNTMKNVKGGYVPQSTNCSRNFSFKNCKKEIIVKEELENIFLSSNETVELSPENTEIGLFTSGVNERGTFFLHSDFIGQNDNDKFIIKDNKLKIKEVLYYTPETTYKVTVKYIGLRYYKQKDFDIIVTNSQDNSTPPVGEQVQVSSSGSNIELIFDNIITSGEVTFGPIDSTDGLFCDIDTTSDFSGNIAVSFNNPGIIPSNDPAIYHIKYDSELDQVFYDNITTEVIEGKITGVVDSLGSFIIQFVPPPVGWGFPPSESLGFSRRVFGGLSCGTFNLNFQNLLPPCPGNQTRSGFNIDFEDGTFSPFGGCGCYEDAGVTVDLIASAASSFGLARAGVCAGVRLIANLRASLPSLKNVVSGLTSALAILQNSLRNLGGFVTRYKTELNYWTTLNNGARAARAKAEEAIIKGQEALRTRRLNKNQRYNLEQEIKQAQAYVEGADRIIEANYKKIDTARANLKRYQDEVLNKLKNEVYPKNKELEAAKKSLADAQAALKAAQDSQPGLVATVSTALGSLYAAVNTIKTPKVCDGQTLNLLTCECCPNCTGGKVFPNPMRGCECECPSGEEPCGDGCYIPCTDGKIRNTSSCGCDCPAGKEPCFSVGNENCYDPCEQGKIRSGDCTTCICIPGGCTGGKIQNPSTCACECPAGKETCGDGCYDPCPPDHSRESDCSCSPYTPFMFSSEISTIEW